MWLNNNPILPLIILLIKKLEFGKTKPTQYSTFKTDIMKVGLVFSISNFFTNKVSDANKWSAFKLQEFSFNKKKLFSIKMVGEKSCRFF